MPFPREEKFYKLSEVNKKPNKSCKVLYVENLYLHMPGMSLAYCSTSLNVCFCFPCALYLRCLHFHLKETLLDLAEQFVQC